MQSRSYKAGMLPILYLEDSLDPHDIYNIDFNYNDCLLKLNSLLNKRETVIVPESTVVKQDDISTVDNSTLMIRDLRNKLRNRDSSIKIEVCGVDVFKAKLIKPTWYFLKINICSVCKYRTVSKVGMYNERPEITKKFTWNKCKEC